MVHGSLSLYTARIGEFFIKRLCSGLWSGIHLAFSPPPIPYSSSFHCFIRWVPGTGGSWLGCGDLPAMGAVIYLGAGWPQWKPLGIPGTHLPLKRGSWLKKMNISSESVTLHQRCEETQMFCSEFGIFCTKCFHQSR